MAIHAIIPTPKLRSRRDRIVCQFVISKLVGQDEIERITLVEQAGESMKHWVPDGIEHVSIDLGLEFDPYHLVCYVSEESKSEHIWILEPNVFFDISKALSYFSGEDFAQPFSHVVSLNRQETREILAGRKIARVGVGNRRHGVLGERGCIVRKKIFNEANPVTEGFGSELTEVSRDLAQRHPLHIYYINAAELFVKTEFNGHVGNELLETVTDIYDERQDIVVRMDDVPEHRPAGGVANPDKLMASFQQVRTDDQFQNGIDFLEKYGRHVSQNVIYNTIQEDRDYVVDIENIWSVGKEVIPAIALGSLSRHIDPRKYKFRDKKEKKYIDWVKDNIDRFPRVIIGNAGIETGRSISTSRNDLQHMRNIISTLYRHFSFVGEKAMFAPFDSFFEREAWLYRGKLKEAPIRSIMLEKGMTGISYCGFWCLYNNIFEMFNHDYFPDVKTAVENTGFGHTVMRYHLYEKPKKRYPYSYFTDYLDGMEIYSGIGHIGGAKRHYLTSLIGHGYAGCLFYLPGEKWEFEDSEGFFTDIANWRS